MTAFAAVLGYVSHWLLRDIVD